MDGADSVDGLILDVGESQSSSVKGFQRDAGVHSFDVFDAAENDVVITETADEVSIDFVRNTPGPSRFTPVPSATVTSPASPLPIPIASSSFGIGSDDDDDEDTFQGDLSGLISPPHRSQSPNTPRQ